MQWQIPQTTHGFRAPRITLKTLHTCETAGQTTVEVETIISFSPLMKTKQRPAANLISQRHVINILASELYSAPLLKNSTATRPTKSSVVTSWECMLQLQSSHVTPNINEQPLVWRKEVNDSQHGHGHIKASVGSVLCGPWQTSVAWWLLKDVLLPVASISTINKALFPLSSPVLSPFPPLPSPLPLP